MAFSQVATSASLHFVKISLHFPKMQGTKRLPAPLAGKAIADHDGQ